MCDFYTFKGHNDSFTIGQFTVTNVSAAGPVMTLDLVRNSVRPMITKYMYRYWVNDPNTAGNRMWHAVQASPNQSITVDFSTFPGSVQQQLNSLRVSDGPGQNRGFPLLLHGNTALPSELHRDTCRHGCDPVGFIAANEPPPTFEIYNAYE